MRPLHFLLFASLLGILVAGSPASADETRGAIATFKRDLKTDNWRDRVEAYTALTFYDSAPIVAPIMDAVIKEPHGAVRLSALRLLGKLSSDEARGALLDMAVKGKGARRTLALSAINEQATLFGIKELERLLTNKEGSVAGMAAQALGRKQAKDAIPALTKLLNHSEWQVRGAAARALTYMAGSKPQILVDEKGRKSEEKKPWIPAWYDIKPVMPVLAQAFGKYTGPDRVAFLDCMERLTRKEFGWSVTAWKLYVAGTDEAQIQARQEHPPYLFGVPITGKRVVVVFDHSLPTDDPHPFRDKQRLKELTKIPDGLQLLYMKLGKKRDFIRAHLTQWLRAIPKTTKFEVIRLAVTANPVFGKFTAANTASRKKAAEAISDAKLVNGQDALSGLNMALDLGGAKASKAWKKGPDTIIYVTCGVPWEAKVTDADYIAAEIGLKAQARLVPIHTVGVGTHPYEMLRVIAEMSGGRYVPLHE